MGNRSHDSFGLGFAFPSKTRNQRGRLSQVWWRSAALRADSWDRIQFVTSRGRESKAYGGSGGDSFSFKATAPAQTAPNK